MPSSTGRDYSPPGVANKALDAFAEWPRPTSVKLLFGGCCCAPPLCGIAIALSRTAKTANRVDIDRVIPRPPSMGG